MSSSEIKSLPSRADYRYVKDLISKFCKDAVHIKSEYDQILSVFKKAGGSWKGVYKGSVEDITLLKKVVKTAYKVGKVTKSKLKEELQQKGRG